MKEGVRAPSSVGGHRRCISTEGVFCRLDPSLKRRFPSNLKLHYTDMVEVAERLSRRLFCRTNKTYHVHRRHKALSAHFPPPTSSDSWVTVHNLRQSDGGILDPDDCLLDVADDREQIIAIYEEATKPQQGDGTSASDESENPSPDIFKNIEHKFEPFSRNDIEITGEALSGTPPPLHVRRGSEPALNRLSPIPPYLSSAPPDPSKRWSAAPVIAEQETPNSSTPLKDKPTPIVLNGELGFDGYPGERGEGSGEEKKTTSSASSSGSSHHSATTTTLSRFSRDGNRCSVQILSDNPNMARWADAAEQLMQQGPPSGTSDAIRREPVGGAATTPHHSRDPSKDDRSNYFTMLVALVNDGSPLGIHVIPSTDRSGLDQGLLVEGIEPDGRVARDGRIQLHDVIIEINQKTLKNVTFHKAQEIFKDAMMDPELQLLVVKRRESRRGAFTPVHGSRGSSYDDKEFKHPVGRKVHPVSLASRTQSVMLQSNTRRLGKKLVINLVKGAHGLGFSITTRDNPAGGEAPIYIKNILAKGAAIVDGTLRIGDRLLEVNGVEVTGYNQSDVAGLLRQIPVGGVASLTVSRQEKVDEFRASINERHFTGQKEEDASPKLPRQLSEKSTEDSLMFPWKQREILTFEIPIHDSERAGLGVSVKGKTSSGPNGIVDLGIFVKNVIHGGAASRDGRLQQNDQLVNINGLSLLRKPNSEAMRTLRTAMHQEGPNPGMITLTVARRLDGSRDPSWSRSGRDSVNSLGTSSSGVETFPVYLGSGSEYTTPTPDNSGTSDHSDGTVIFNGVKEGSIDVGKDYNNMHLDRLSTNNPVIQRITGGSTGINNNNAALRNESYYKATHDTWNQSQFQQVLTPSGKERIPKDITPYYDDRGFGSPTVNLPPTDTVIIHDEYDIPPNIPRFYNNQNEARPSIGSMHGATNEQFNQVNDAYMSQSSLEESGTGFSRDQFGRQSMSEKRHATLDAKSTDTYQRSKKAREDREKKEKEHKNDSNEPRGRSLTEVGPALGMRKSSSLESLQTMVQEMAMEEEGQRVGPGGKVPRGRGCNESFRAAVDRSYEAPISQLGSQMETLAEEESESSGSGFGRGNSRQSSVNSVEERLRKGKKKPSLLKGLGSMFRFGRHRKSLDGPIGIRRDENSRQDGTITAAKSIQEAQRRIQPENYEGNKDLYWNRGEVDKSETFQGGDSQFRPSQDGSSVDEDGNPTRSERMHNLRAEHQRRHAQRNRTYPTDRIEEAYDQAITKVSGESSGHSADKANNNMHKPSDMKQEQVMASPPVCSTPLSSSQANSISHFTFSSSTLSEPTYPPPPPPPPTNPSLPSDKELSKSSRGKGGNRASFYGSCIKPMRNSPSPPNVENVPVSREAKSKSNQDQYGPYIKDDQQSSSSNVLSNQHLGDSLKDLIVHKNINHKPPLPPRNRPLNNNYKAPVPPPNPKPPQYCQTIHRGEKGNPPPSHSKENNFEGLISPEFSFTFQKPLPPLSHPSIDHQSAIKEWEDVFTRVPIDTDAQNFVNQVQSDLNASLTLSGVSNRVNHSNGSTSTGVDECNNATNINKCVQLSETSSHDAIPRNMSEGSNIPPPLYPPPPPPPSRIAQPLSSSSSSNSNSSGHSAGSLRTTALPRMGLKGKTAANKWGRCPPAPAPPPPPKSFPNPMAPLRSTEVLEKSQFWRLEPVPPEPKAEVRHIRSQSYDVYGDGYKNRLGRRSPFGDPHKFSHYVNYEQIQMHLRNNEEQDRLAKLASRQYQDFRDKQTSREQREYQSQRCSREVPHQQRPISNYFEYESVQAIISNSYDSTSTSSLPRRGGGPHTRQASAGNHPSAGGSIHASAFHHAQQKSLPSHHQMQNHSSTSLSSKGSNQQQQHQSSGRIKSHSNQAPQPKSSSSFQPHVMRTTNMHPPPPPPQMLGGGTRETIYTASGYRPASHYSSHLPLTHHTLVPHNSRPTTLTVPGSKV